MQKLFCYLTPEAAKIDSLMQIYQRDTVGKEYVSLFQTYQYKDSIYRDQCSSCCRPQ